MRLGIAQRNFGVGAFEANVRIISEAFSQLQKSGAELVLTSEMSVCGYPAYDLLDRPEFFERCDKAIADLCRMTAKTSPSSALVVGHVSKNPAATGRSAFNCVSVLQNGKTTFTQAKSLLPTYDVFDEARYFAPAESVEIWSGLGSTTAFAICEDLWGKAMRYPKDPTHVYRSKGAKQICALSASPYEMHKQKTREDIHREVAIRLACPVIYVNQWGATDEVLFDGQSFGVRSDGSIAFRLNPFEDATLVYDPMAVSELNATQEIPEIEVLLRALICGIRDYFRKTGFSKAILGLSGGIDSALVAFLAVEALGKEHVLGVAMPGPYSSGHSLEDAEQLAKNLGIRCEVRPIKFAYSTFARELAVQSTAQGLSEITQENLQARLRGLILVSLANHHRSLVLNTGNKSELAMGYSTQYGDLIGALCPIGDLYKSKVYDLVRHIQRVFGDVIPPRTVSKMPSAELRPGQVDQDSLPPYEELDTVLEDYLEKRLPVADIKKKYQFQWMPEVERVLRIVELNEFKRRQAPPVLKVTPKAFGSGRRLPIAKEWTPT